MVKGELTFDPSLTARHVAQTLSGMCVNPHVIFNNLNPAVYSVMALVRKEEHEENVKKRSTKRKLLYAFLVGLAMYEIGDVFFGLPGLVDLGETIYLASSMHASHAIYPWQWKWNRAKNLALQINDLDSLKGIFTGSSDLLKLIDYYHQAISIIPPNLRSYYEYVEEEVILGYSAIFPSEELDFIGYALVDSLFEDGKFIKQKEEIWKNLMNWDRWWIVRDIIKSGVLKGKNLSEDFDLDGIDNLTEILQGTNPLNYLEIDPSNLSERYVVIAWLAGGLNYVEEAKKICEILVKNGYTNKNVFLTFEPLERKSEGWVFSPEIVKDFPLEVDHILQPFLLRGYFLDDIRGLPSDENDIVFIHSNSHGNINHINPGDSISVQKFNDVIKQLKYGELIITVNACHSGAFLKQLDMKPNILAIATMSETERSDNSITPFIKYLDLGLSVKEAFDKFAYRSNIDNIHPVMYSGREKPFTNPLVYKKIE